ncbi:hypothetical protein ACFX2I_044311 [Malus domestica]
MALMRGEPLVAKLAALAKYVVFPGAMAAAVIYSPPGAYCMEGDARRTITKYVSPFVQIWYVIIWAK